ncbi:hypothetical protein [Alkalihalobacillus sp. AL-G]|uniref:hypothetical protein n=1 Tax=Alkalihalobacillus sp. AL-G TaxID=2926399 RepID=UPI00272A6930|nr:hypothetical protein [Alkalihalobacillus sp. AL-G]WLD94503.1 hypothetical protein MOJ78_06345 [Alkalihalobacillus sp. AL-G]
MKFSKKLLLIAFLISAITTNLLTGCNSTNSEDSSINEKVGSNERIYLENKAVNTVSVSFVGENNNDVQKPHVKYYED